MSIDLAVVTHTDTVFNTKEIAYAPYGQITVGAEVFTSTGLGTVVECLYTYEEDDVFRFFKKNTKIVPILSVVKKIHYEFEGEKNDLST